MKTQHHDILIPAPREHVWRCMLCSPTYERWTATFCEGSRYEGGWDEGATIRFCGPNGVGMVAEIAEHRPAEFVSIRHLGMIQNGVEDTSSEAVRAWAPCFENYSFADEAGGTRLRVDVDVFGDLDDWMAQTWPKALQSLKTLCSTPTKDPAMSPSATVPMCAVVHFEMPYKDRERAARFYAAAFGWTHQFLGPEMGDYTLVNTAPPGARPHVPPQAALGSINGGLFPYKADWPMQHPSVVVGVPDIRAAMQRVRDAGGEVIGEPMAIPGVGEYVVFRDTEGNHNSMMQPTM